MPLSLSPLRIQATTLSLSRYIGVALNETVTRDLEPEFKYCYEAPTNSYREIFTLLPLAIRTGRVTERTKQLILRRVVLRDHRSLTRFFVTIIKCPQCVRYVEELHCYVDLSKPTSAECLKRDLTLLSGITGHLNRCPISLDILISIRQHMVGELENQPYRPGLEVGLRQAMFLSLLGHLRHLDALRMTIYGPAHQTLSWLRSELERHYPTQFVQRVPCLNISSSIRKVSFYAADDHQPSSVWHPLALWPLINLPNVTEFEIENNPATWPISKHLAQPSSPNDKHNEDASSIPHACFKHIQILRIKNFRPTHILSHHIFASLKALHTLEICSRSSNTDVPLPSASPNHAFSEVTASYTGREATTQNKRQEQAEREQTREEEPEEGEGEETNLNTLLTIPSVARTLQYLSIDDASATPESAALLFGPSRRLAPGCLMGLAELGGLYIPAFALSGVGVVGEHSAGQAHEGGVREWGVGGVGGERSVMGGSEGVMVRLPGKLERLEIVEDPDIRVGRLGEGSDGVEDAGIETSKKVRWLLESLAQCCARGMYPALKTVVLWRRTQGDNTWSSGEQEQLKAVFSTAGAAFECSAYQRWPEGKVGGWRLIGNKGANGGG